ncbi:MAG: hypothetical protein SPJ62_12765 [Inconstantimicrobium porci]|uniref:Uncharacterized protein n=1 Tax=Inconstantimicrobium porci TaxID=2652291 RepID=A0A7X2MXX3_9CLOT|nr:hypothetical protein [Inconstantimicrobium porci]MDD6771654.1 hypothetical protein [Inconstantimicrobium porci]MDY5912844.1 hypothetical protein [Inconstantimicrobium porci]MSR91101.1 hypothetical protein [Inconstantimicrobium porci]
MGFKDKLTKYYTDSYMQKYGDRMTQFQGNVISVKVEEKCILWIFHKIQAFLIIKPERSRSIIKCRYRKNKWFKKPEFMKISQGHTVIVQGLKSQVSKKDPAEIIDVMNILNMTTKKDLVPVDHSQLKKVRQKQVMR